MSALDAADTWPTADGPILQHRVAGQVEVLGTYLTDEVFLYRIAGVGSDGPVETIELEDCYWLDVVHVSVGDLRARRLHPVTPSTIKG